VLATEKTEAIMLRRKYKDTVSRILFGNTIVTMKKTMKDLGIIVDDSLRFSEHVKVTADKAQKIMLLLSRIMPNVGGPREARRKLLASVVHSIILYGAPVWGPSLEYSKQRTDQLLSVQRRATLGCICAYRTTPQVTATVIASMPPIDILVRE